MDYFYTWDNAQTNVNLLSFSIYYFFILKPFEIPFFRLPNKHNLSRSDPAEFA